MRSAGPFAAVASLVVVVPVVVVAVFGAGAAPTGQASVGGVGQGLRAGAVPAAYAALVLQAGSMCPAAPPSVIAAQIEQESGWDPHSVSPAGAQGISQFMPGTWPGWSLPGQSPFDPAAAIPAQGRYDCAIAAELEPGQRAGRYGGTGLTSLMLAGYNAGPGAVTAAGGIPNNGETPAYVARITAGAAHYAETTGV
ncbi:MAG TPA: lytic transglycosylase domain-containing protein, partial [Dermatophilaceae bacterium]